MNTFNKKSISFWFVLLAVAILNASIREFTYKPLLEPLIGNWAHQLSSLTAIIFFIGNLSIFKAQSGIYRSESYFFGNGLDGHDNNIRK